VRVYGSGYDFSKPGAMDYTNDTLSGIQTYQDGVVYPHDYQTLKLEYYRYWLQYFEEMNNYRILEKWVGKGYGWCDKDEIGTDPYLDDVHYNVIDCGLNIRETVGEIVKNGIYYVLVNMVPIDSQPYAELNYIDNPQLIQVQTAITKNGTWRSPEQGFVKWPNWGSDEVMAYNRANCRYFPETPFDAVLYGVDVTITDLCWQGSTTWGEVADHGWYILEECTPPANLVEPNAAKTDRDCHQYIVHPDWPPPSMGESPWTKS